MKNLNDLQLSTRTINTLIKNGVETIEQLVTMSFEDLIQIKGISKKTAEEIMMIIDEHSKKSVGTLNNNVENSTSFSINNTYIFTKKRYISIEGRKMYKENRSWVNKLNGRIVINGVINEIEISKKWCIVA